MLDLFHHQYPIKILIENIYAVSLIDLLKTQQLTEFFITNYILNSDYQLTEEEMQISIADVIKYQPHINMQNILDNVYLAPVTYINPNFETVSL
jgi:hypothetical protein